MKEINPGDQIGGYTIIKRNMDLTTSRYFDVVCQYGFPHIKAASLLDGSNCKNKECINSVRKAFINKGIDTVLSKKYAHWKPLKHIPSPGIRDAKFLCICDCGEERIITSRQLINEKLRPACKNKERYPSGKLKRPSRYIPLHLRVEESEATE